MKKLYFILFILTMMSCQAETKRTGYAALVIQNGDIICEEVSGFRDLNGEIAIDNKTNFRMASVSKQFTSACIVLLKNDGLLNYDDPLSRFFPDFNFGDQITLKHILTHSSGMLDYELMIPDNQSEQVTDFNVLNWVADADSLYFTPGTAYKYINSGYCILSQVVEKVSGKSYDQFIEERIFKPLKMSNSYIYKREAKMSERALGYATNKENVIYENDQSITSATMGDGCVYTSLTDYKKWIESLRDNILFNLNDEIAEVARPVEGQDKLSYALGWFVYDNKEIYHTGSTSGFSNVVWLSSDANNAIVYFSNLADNHADILKFKECYNEINPRIDFIKVLNLTD